MAWTKAKAPPAARMPYGNKVPEKLTTEDTECTEGTENTLLGVSPCPPCSLWSSSVENLLGEGSGTGASEFASRWLVTMEKAGAERRPSEFTNHQSPITTN
jgi:hypothetical protein